MKIGKKDSYKDYKIDLPLKEERRGFILEFCFLFFLRGDANGHSMLYNY